MKTISRAAHRTTARHVPDLERLLDTCACNYERLMGVLALASVVEQWPDRAALQITTIDSDRYTSTISMQEKGTKHHYSLQLNRLIVRLYHDASLAEVLQWPDKRVLRGSYPYPNHRMAQRDEKEQLNQYLTEWLQDLVARRVAIFRLHNPKISRQGAT